MWIRPRPSSAPRSITPRIGSSLCFCRGEEDERGTTGQVQALLSQAARFLVAKQAKLLSLHATGALERLHSHLSCCLPHPDLPIDSRARGLRRLRSEAQLAGVDYL